MIIYIHSQDRGAFHSHLFYVHQLVVSLCSHYPVLVEEASLAMRTTALFYGHKHNEVEGSLADTSCLCNKTTAVACPLGPPQS